MQLRHRAFGASDRDTSLLERRKHVHVLTARRVESERGVDNVGVAGNANAESLPRLCYLLLREAEALTRGDDFVPACPAPPGTRGE